MRHRSLPAASLLLVTTLVYACTAAKAPATNGPTAMGPLPAQSAKAPTINPDIAGKLFAHRNKATPKGDIQVATLYKDDTLGVVVGNYRLRVDPAKTMSTKSDHEEDAAATDETAETPDGTDVAATPKPTPMPNSGDEADDADEVSPGSDQVAHAESPDDEEWDTDEWDTNNDPADDEWLDPEAKDDPEDIDAYGETDVSFRGGAPHHLVFHENDYPVMDDRQDSVTIEDQGAGKKRATITVDQDFLHFTITGASGKTVSITINPDGTYAIDGRTVGTNKEAAQLLNAALSNDELTHETLAFLYASLKGRDGMIRTLIPSGGNPVGPGSGGKEGDVISPTGLVQAMLGQRRH